MDPTPRHFLSVGSDSATLKAGPVSGAGRVLPAVKDLATLEEALKAYPVTVAVIGPDWPEADIPAARELILSYAAGCGLAADHSAAAIDAAVVAALAERSVRVEAMVSGRLMELLPDAVFFKDRCSRFLAANGVIARHLGVDDPALLIGRSDFDFFSPEHAQQAFADEQEIIRTGRPIEAKLEMETYDEGRDSWCLSWKAPLRDRDGRVIGTYGMARDVTELKMTEGALATERHLLEALLTGMPDSVFIKDKEGRFLLANHIVAQWMGETPASLRGKRDADFYTEEEAAAFRQDEEDVMASGMPVVNREECIRSADGRELWVLTTKLPYRNAAGEIVGIIGMSRNISLRKAFDDQLKEAHAEIASLRAELTRLKGGAAPKTSAG